MTHGSKTSDGIVLLENAFRWHGGRSEEWYVGISYDAAERLRQHGQQDNKKSAVVAFRNARDARNAEAYLLATRMQGAPGGGLPDKPPTQVYIYRIPKA